MADIRGCLRAAKVELESERVATGELRVFTQVGETLGCSARMLGPMSAVCRENCQ